MHPPKTIPQTVIVFCAFQGSKDVRLIKIVPQEKASDFFKFKEFSLKETTDLKGFVEQKTWSLNLNSFNVSILPATKLLSVLPPWLCQLKPELSWF